MQVVMTSGSGYEQLDDYIREHGLKSIFLVCGNSARSLDIGRHMFELPGRFGIRLVTFSDYSPNPDYESVVKGTALFKKEPCDAIFAIGGGSAMDVAKCIRLYSNMADDIDYTEQEIIPCYLPFVAVPTTAGTGSEATHFAVIYKNGRKTSVADMSCIPDAVLFDPAVLYSLPEYQKKATMLDALCHGIESIWSVKSDEESRGYAVEAVETVLGNYRGYLSNDPEGCTAMLRAANLAGKAINITQTTAGHAMCYKLTGLYGIAHGHGAALCVRELISYIPDNIRNCSQPGGEKHLSHLLDIIAGAFGSGDMGEVRRRYDELLDELEIGSPEGIEDDIGVLCSSVDPQRLGNNPVRIPPEDMERMYRSIVLKSV